MILLAIVTSLILPPPRTRVGPGDRPTFQRIEMPSALHEALMKKLDGMSAGDEGVFNEDVSSLVATYFPRGQKIEDTQRVAREQDLGQLQPFMGRTGPEDGTMFVSRFSLMSRQFSNVFIVVDFGFMRSPSSGLILDHVKAFMRADQM